MKIEIKAELTTRDTIRFLEIVQDGEVERRVQFEEFARTGSLGTVRFRSSGWFLVRAIADNPKTFRFASTAPFYVEVGDAKRRVSKPSARFFLEWVRERAGRVKLDDPEQRREVLQVPHGGREVLAGDGQQGERGLAGRQCWIGGFGSFCCRFSPLCAHHFCAVFPGISALCRAGKSRTAEFFFSSDVSSVATPACCDPGEFELQ